MFNSIQIPRIQGRRALLIINCQNDAFNSNGPQMAPQPADFLARIKRIIPYYRGLGTDIVWVQTEVLPKMPTDETDGSPVYDLADYMPSSRSEEELQPLSDEDKARRVDAASSQWAIDDSVPTFKRLKGGHELVDELAEMLDKQHDIVITKHYYSAFDQTPLLVGLRMKMVTNIHLCGGLSNISIINTAAEAAQHGFEVSVVEDCLGYRSEELHLEAMRKMADEIGVHGVDSDEIIEEAGGRPVPDADPDIFSGPGISGINISHGGETGEDKSGGVQSKSPTFKAKAKSRASSSNATSRAPTQRRPPQPSASSPAPAPPAPLLTQGRIGEGDSRLITSALPPDLASTAFERVKAEVEWQAMKHRTGDVPRRVAVQGEINATDGSVPVYRHPTDESPPLLPFTETIKKIRDSAQKLLHQPFNHVLIQLYRSGHDNISEHTDKTLDIVRDSVIVNVSLGAERKMTLRLKKAAISPSSPAAAPANREVQRIPLPNNSIFVLGPKTNARWLHGVRADKRLPAERTEPEKAFGGERISLTFRLIGTWTNPERTRIWGQGAKGKCKGEAREVLAADSEEARAMVLAFGRENHMAPFNWEAEYGAGFDALDLVVVNKPPAG